MPWQFNSKGGISKKGGQSSFQKRHQVLATWLVNGNKPLLTQGD
jgi:hypothetical protein